MGSDHPKKEGPTREGPTREGPTREGPTREGKDHEDRERRTTLVPAFDVPKFARAIEPERARAPMLTITDADALEAARQASARSDPPISSSGAAPESEEAAIARYKAKLSPLTRVPVVVPSAQALAAMKSDRRAAFLLTFVDGLLSLETILEVAGMPLLDTLRIVDDLVERRVIRLS